MIPSPAFFVICVHSFLTFDLSSITILKRVVTTVHFFMIILFEKKKKKKKKRVGVPLLIVFVHFFLVQCDNWTMSSQSV